MKKEALGTMFAGWDNSDGGTAHECEGWLWPGTKSANDSLKLYHPNQPKRSKPVHDHSRSPARVRRPSCNNGTSLIPASSPKAFPSASPSSHGITCHFIHKLMGGMHTRWHLVRTAPRLSRQSVCATSRQKAFPPIPSSPRSAYVHTRSHIPYPHQRQVRCDRTMSKLVQTILSKVYLFSPGARAPPSYSVNKVSKSVNSCLILAPEKHSITCRKYIMFRVT